MQYKYRIYDGPSCGAGVVGYCNAKADADLMAGSKELVKREVERLRDINYVYGREGQGALARVVDQLKKMGVAVAEFKKKGVE